MYNKLKKVMFEENLIIIAEFNDGTVNSYDLKRCIDKYPVFKQLQENKTLYKNGYISIGGSGIIFSDEIDIAAEELYKNGTFIEKKRVADIYTSIAISVSKARKLKGLTQSELAKITGIHQAEISKIERGIGNPSVKTLDRIAKGLGLNLELFLR